MYSAKDLYEDFKSRLKACGYSVERFCRETGFSSNTLRDFSRVGSNPTIKLCRDIDQAIRNIENR